MSTSLEPRAGARAGVGAAPTPVLGAPGAAEAARPSRPAPLRLVVGTVRALVLPLAILLLWEGLVRLGMLPQVVPSPTRVVEGWYTWVFGSSTQLLNAYAGTWLDAALFSARRVTQGFLIAAVLAVPLGVMIAWNRLVGAMVDPTIQLLRPIPITAWVPFAIAVLGIRDPSALFLIFLGAFYPTVVNTAHGVRETNRNLIRAARMLGASEWTILRRVVLPSALPNIFTGLRLGIGVAWMAVVVAEMIAVKSGLGYVLWDAYYVGRMDICIAAMLSVGMFGFLSDRLILLADHSLLRWKRLESHR